MLAAQVEALGRMVLAEKPVPVPGPDSLLIKVEGCAICGSDVRIFRKGDARARYPIVIGHEIAGVVAAVGANLKGFKEGDRVCAAPGHGCGKCRYCLSGHSNVCIDPCPSIGYASDGGFAEYVVPPDNVVRLGFVNSIPNGLSFEDATMSELLACCLNADRRTHPSTKGTWCWSWAPARRVVCRSSSHGAAGAAKVLLTQRSRSRLELAQRFNPDRIIASGEEDLVAAVMAESAGLGADVIFVCAPSKDAQEQALTLLAPRGRVNFFGGLPKDNAILATNANTIHYKELFVSGASSSLARQNREALALLASGQISAPKYITHRFPLDQIVAGFETVESRQAIKVVIQPGGASDR